MERKQMHKVQDRSHINHRSLLQAAGRMGQLVRSKITVDPNWGAIDQIQIQQRDTSLGKRKRTWFLVKGFSILALGDESTNRDAI